MLIARFCPPPRILGLIYLILAVALAVAVATAAAMAVEVTMKSHVLSLELDLLWCDAGMIWYVAMACHAAVFHTSVPIVLCCIAYHCSMNM